MRSKYRSAIYAEGEEEEAEARAALDALRGTFSEPLVTRVLARRAFRLSAERFHDYYATDPERPFCRTYIDPKLTLLRERFSTRLGDA